jgi:hypothetical protein
LGFGYTPKPYLFPKRNKKGHRYNVPIQGPARPNEKHARGARFA